MRQILRHAAAIGAGVLLTLGMLAGPADAAPNPGSGPATAEAIRQSSAADLAKLKAANGGRDVVLVNNMRAAGGREACDSGSFCAWADSNFSDGPGQWPNNASNYAAWGHSSCILGLTRWTNCASSVFNNGNSCNIQLYDDTGYSTRNGYYNLAKGGYLANLKFDRMTDGNDMNDRISSHKWCTW